MARPLLAVVAQLVVARVVAAVPLAPVARLLGAVVARMPVRAALQPLVRVALAVLVARRLLVKVALAVLVARRLLVKVAVPVPVAQAALAAQLPD